MAYIVGIDEVGRGSLAGPVCVATVAMPKNLKFSARGARPSEAGRRRGSAFGGKITNLGRLRDSKKLTAKQREAWFNYFKNHPDVNYEVARVYPRQIEKRNISLAANLAASRAYVRLMANSKWRMVKHRVFLDGGLYLGNKRKQLSFRAKKGASISVRTIVRGDEKIKAIAAASIIAKVTRDRQMIRLAKKHSRYGFETHKGYGTKKHLTAIKRYGVSKVHRKTFC